MTLDARHELLYPNGTESLTPPPSPSIAPPVLSTEIQQLHKEACTQEKLTYQEPTTGYSVLTEYAHRKRGKCCGNQCRHCAFDYVNVPQSGTGSTRTEEKAVVLTSPQKVLDVVAWFDRIVLSGNSSLVWMILRNFGFNGMLVKKKQLFHKSQIPPRLVK